MLVVRKKQKTRRMAGEKPVIKAGAPRLRHGRRRGAERERERERGVCHLCLLGGTHQAWHDGHKVTVLSSTTGRLASAGPWGAVESGQVGEGRRRRRGAPPGSHLVDQLQHDVARAVAVARHGDAAVLVDALEDRGAHHVLVAVAAHAALLGGYLGTGLGAAQACDGRRGQQRDATSGAGKSCAAPSRRGPGAWGRAWRPLAHRIG